MCIVVVFVDHTEVASCPRAKVNVSFLLGGFNFCLVSLAMVTMHRSNRSGNLIRIVYHRIYIFE